MILVSFVVGGISLRFNYDFSEMDVIVPQEQEIKDRFYQVYETVRSPGTLFAAEGLTTLDDLIIELNVKKDERSSRIQRFHSICEFCPVP